jgi:hypothetical protein
VRTRASESLHSRIRNDQWNPPGLLRPQRRQDPGRRGEASTYYGRSHDRGPYLLDRRGGTGGLGDGRPGTDATISGIVVLASHIHQLAFTDVGDQRVRMILR